ncbi:MAG: histidine triad nucleotide-binding protein [Gammaproteobacteria bacterium]
MADKTLFERIIAREIPATIIHEDDRCIAFKDINPQAPFHALVVPVKPIPKVGDAGAADEPLLGHLLTVASRVAREAGYGEAFRLAINHGAGAGQTVFHLHVHVLAGRPMSWPPG